MVGPKSGEGFREKNWQFSVLQKGKSFIISRKLSTSFELLTNLSRRNPIWNISEGKPYGERVCHQ